MELRLGEKQTLVIVKKVEFRSVSGNEGSTGGQSAAAGEAGAGRSKGRR